jgi:hypothetical protein
MPKRIAVAGSVAGNPLSDLISRGEFVFHDGVEVWENMVRLQ